jgi:hypothetical protein
MLGLAAGLLFGALQFWILWRFTGCIAGGSNGHLFMLLGLSQYLLPLLVLIVAAFFWFQELILTAIGLTVVPIIGAVWYAYANLHGKKKGDRYD